MRCSSTGKGGGFITCGIQKMNSYWKLINHVEWFVSTLDIWLGCTFGLSGFVVWKSFSGCCNHRHLWHIHHYGKGPLWAGQALLSGCLFFSGCCNHRLWHIHHFERDPWWAGQVLLSTYLFSNCCKHHRLWNIHHFRKRPLWTSWALLSGYLFCSGCWNHCCLWSMHHYREGTLWAGQVL